MAGDRSEGLLSGVIIGAAVGAIAGILAAPRTGKDTRRILKKSADALPELAEDLATSIQFQADRLSDRSLNNWEQTLERLREAVIAGRAAGRQEWERQSTSGTNIQTEHPAANEASRVGSDIASSGLTSGDLTDQLDPPAQTANWPSTQSAALEE